MARPLRRLFVGYLLMAALGCHADPDDPEGQAKELADPQRRFNAAVNLHKIYTKVLREHGGDRNNPDVKKVADVIEPALTAAYVGNPTDTQGGLQILKVLAEIQRPESLPALLQALEWRREVTEEHAEIAAKTLSLMDLRAGKKEEVASALSKALDKVNGNRREDRLLRIAFVRALGSLEHPRAIDALSKVVVNQDPEQPFLINRLAAEQLGRLKDPAAIAVLIEALFLFAPNNPAMRMNDVAGTALVRLGRPALEPMLNVLAGKDESANAIAKQYIEAVRKRDASVAEEMSVEQVTASEATYVLGSLGFEEAFEPLLKEARKNDWRRSVNAALALSKLEIGPAKRPALYRAIEQAYVGAPKTAQGIGARGQLMGAAAHTYGAEAIDFLAAQAADQDLFAELRLEAMRMAALLANAAEKAKLEELIQKEPPSEDGGYREKFKENTAALELAKACNENLDCWISKLQSRDALTLRKAAVMLGRYGRGNSKAVDALVGVLDFPDLEVRLAAVRALDHAAAKGSAEAIEKIDSMRKAEEGRAIWKRFEPQAQQVQARLASRL